jgi:hypothetical protein
MGRELERANNYKGKEDPTSLLMPEAKDAYVKDDRERTDPSCFLSTRLIRHYESEKPAAPPGIDRKPLTGDSPITAVDKEIRITY